MMKNENEYNLIFEFLKGFKTRFVSHKKLIFSRQLH